MDRSEIIKQLEVIFREVFADDRLEVRDELTANDVEKWDSLSNTIMVDKVEKHFKVKLKFSEIVNMANVGELIDLLQKKMA